MKKISREKLYVRKTIKHIIDVNGKEIRIYEYIDNDDFMGYDYDTVIDDEDKKKLTDEELEELEDNLTDLISE
jgi:hypothetical protein